MKIFLLRRLSLVALAAITVVGLRCHVTLAKPAQTPAQPKPSSKPSSPTHDTRHTGSGKRSFSSAYNGYVSQLRTKLDKNWYLADGKNEVTISVHVAPDGSVTELTVKSSQANSQAEQAASDAFNQSQPLPSLPAGSPAVMLTLVFSSEADPHGANTRDLTGVIQPLDSPGGSGASSDPAPNGASRTPAGQSATNQK